MTCEQFSSFYSRPIARGWSCEIRSTVPPDPHRGFVAMHARNGCSATVKKFVIRLIDRVTTERQTNRRLSPLRRRPRRRSAPGLMRTSILTTLAQAWSVTTAAVVLLSVAVSLAPMWDRAIFVKSLLEALTANPALLQGL
jgi:hypothetical protein